MLNLNDALLKDYTKIPFLLFLSALLIFSTATYYLHTEQEKLTDEISLKDRSLSTLLKQVRFLRSQKSSFLKYGSRYQAFIKEGLVTELDRVKWTDELFKIQKKLGLYNLNIQFEAEKKLTKKEAEYLKLTKNIFFYSRLNITAGVYSDLDVLKIMSLINTEITPLYIVKECTLSGEANKFFNPIFEKSKPLIQLSCSIILFQSKPNEFRLKL